MTDQGMTIPKEVYKKAFETLTERYKEKFGMHSIDQDIGICSKEEYISVYQENLAFWRQECPKLEEINNIDKIACYAICSNSIKKVETVLAHLSDE